MKVLFYTNIPSPYRVDFFNELGKYCDLTVLFERERSTERNDAWRNFEFRNFKGVILKGVRTRVDAAFCPEIIKYIKREKADCVVITQLSSLTAIWAVLYMRLCKRPYFYEGDGGFVNSTKGLKAKLKSFIIGAAVKCFSPSKLFDEYCMAYGAKKENIERYHFTSVFAKDVLKETVRVYEKSQLKKKLGIEEDKMILSVGSFIHRKGFDVLMNAMENLPKEWGVYIVGGEPTEEYMKLKEELNLYNLHFAGYKQWQELKQYYMAADLFVFPTREDIWGLVINEAMANGLPVISTDRCIAARELILDDKNGYLVKSGNVEKLYEAILRAMGDMDKLTKMSETSLEIIKKNYTIENMALEHFNAFRKMIKAD